jgi:hypothetical protein
MKIKTDNKAIVSLIEAITALAQERFGKRCVAVYLMGSLSRGGFSESTSDIDMGIILEDVAQGAEQIEAIKGDAVQKYPHVKNNISIFWGTIASINGRLDAGRYPPFDRLDLIEHALLLCGKDIRNRLLRPTRRELEIASAEFALDYLGSQERIQEFLDCSLLAKKGEVYVTKTVLFPPRFLYMAQTGEVAGNDVSCEYYTKNFSGGDARLVAEGYRWRMESLPDDTDTVAKVLEVGLRDLYCKFIDLYVEKMDIYGEQDLKTKLLAWRKKLRA